LNRRRRRYRHGRPQCNELHTHRHCARTDRRSGLHVGVREREVCGAVLSEGQRRRRGVCLGRGELKTIAAGRNVNDVRRDESPKAILKGERRPALQCARSGRGLRQRDTGVNRARGSLPLIKGTRKVRRLTSVARESRTRRGRGASGGRCCV